LIQTLNQYSTTGAYPEIHTMPTWFQRSLGTANLLTLGAAGTIHSLVNTFAQIFNIPTAAEKAAAEQAVNDANYRAEEQEKLVNQRRMVSGMTKMYNDYKARWEEHYGPNAGTLPVSQLAMPIIQSLRNYDRNTAKLLETYAERKRVTELNIYRLNQIKAQLFPLVTAGSHQAAVYNLLNCPVARLPADLENQELLVNSDVTAHLLNGGSVGDLLNNLGYTNPIENYATGQIDASLMPSIQPHGSGTDSVNLNYTGDLPNIFTPVINTSGPTQGVTQPGQDNID
ncbi:MAG TPA: hypothetical protein VEF04_11505, partial [Blastocatellia bacterium]|nr:hypothetical protein [Blastocatellia bacterium]